MKKKQTIGNKILSYIRRNPDAKPIHIARNLGVKVSSVYQAVYRSKKESKLPSTNVPNGQMSLALFSDPPKKRGRPVAKSSPKKEVKDNVNHPSHYKVGGIETIDFIEAKSLSYNLGNVVKYLTRADHKGNKIEDLKKAQWYLNREVSTLEKK